MPEAPAILRLACFAGVLLALLLAERLWPREPAPVRGRWVPNLSLAVLGSVLARLVIPLGATGVALLAESRGWGLLALAAWPAWAKGLGTFVALDLLLYLQHRASHAWPVLWRLHRMHHSELALDATTGVRFHPLEIVLSLLLKSAVIVVLGAPALAVLAFEIALNACSMFNHANLRVAPRAERALRVALITPALHRIHHSTRRDRHDSNFGFSGPWWDRLFGTYREDSLDEPVGLQDFRDPADQRLAALLRQPFSSRR